MAALDLMVNCLADIVQETGTLCGGDINAKLGCNKAGNVRHLDRVIEHILTVAGAVSHAAEKLDKLLIKTVDISLEHGSFAFGLDGGVDLLLSLGDHFLNAGRMNSAVGNELFKCDTGDLTANGVKAGNSDGLGGVVDDEIAAGKSFNAADVTTLAADDASLHLVVGERYDGDGDFACMVGGAALDGGDDDLSCTLIGFFLVLSLDLLDLDGHFMRNFVFQSVDEVVFSLLNGVARNLFEHFELAFLDECYLGLLSLDGGNLLC